MSSQIILDTTKGFVPPQFTTTQKNAIVSPVTGAVVFDTTLNALCVYENSTWNTLPSAGNNPAFSAYLTTSQTVTAGVETIIQFNTEDFDTNSCFDTSTYRFTPNVAGYYQLNWRIRFTSSSSSSAISNAWSTLQKNGSQVFRATESNQSTSTFVQTCSSTMIYMNGTTDYVQISGWLSGSGTLSFETADPSNMRYTCSFSGFLARAA